MKVCPIHQDTLSCKTPFFSIEKHLELLFQTHYVHHQSKMVSRKKHVLLNPLFELALLWPSNINKGQKINGL